MSGNVNFALPMCLLGVYRANISFTLILLEKLGLLDACSSNLIAPYLFIYSRLLNEAFSNPDYLVSNVSKISK